MNKKHLPFLLCICAILWTHSKFQFNLETVGKKSNLVECPLLIPIIINNIIIIIIIIIISVIIITIIIIVRSYYYCHYYYYQIICQTANAKSWKTPALSCCHITLVDEAWK